MAASAPKSDDEDSLERSFNSSVRSTTSGKRPLRHARSASSIFSQLPQVDSSILETVTLEHRDKFTVVFDHLFLCNFVQEKRVSYTFSFHANTTTTKSFYLIVCTALQSGCKQWGHELGDIQKIWRLYALEQEGNKEYILIKT